MDRQKQVAGEKKEVDVRGVKWLRKILCCYMHLSQWNKQDLQVPFKFYNQETPLLAVNLITEMLHSLFVGDAFDLECTYYQDNHVYFMRSNKHIHTHTFSHKLSVCFPAQVDCQSSMPSHCLLTGQLLSLCNNWIKGRDNKKWFTVKIVGFYRD